MLLRVAICLQLADFGFSKDPKQQSEAKTRVGTPAYLAPEVIAAQPGRSYDAQVRRWRAAHRAITSIPAPHAMFMELVLAGLGFNLRLNRHSGEDTAAACWLTSTPAPGRRKWTSGHAACCCT